MLGNLGLYWNLKKVFVTWCFILALTYTLPSRKLKMSRKCQVDHPGTWKSALLTTWNVLGETSGVPAAPLLPGQLDPKLVGRPPEVSGEARPLLPLPLVPVTFATSHSVGALTPPGRSSQQCLWPTVLPKPAMARGLVSPPECTAIDFLQCQASPGSLTVQSNVPSPPQWLHPAMSILEILAKCNVMVPPPEVLGAHDDVPKLHGESGTAEPGGEIASVHVLDPGWREGDKRKSRSLTFMLNTILCDLKKKGGHDEGLSAHPPQKCLFNKQKMALLSTFDFHMHPFPYLSLVSKQDALYKSENEKFSTGHGKLI